MSRRAFVPERPIEAVREYAPWAVKIVKVTGGWMAFDSLGDFQTWIRQR